MPPVRQAPGFSLLAISDRSGVAGGALEPWILRLGAAGVGAVQIREKDLSDRDLLALAQTARRLLPPETTLLINGRADVAQAVEPVRPEGGGIGVHLPSGGLPIAALRDRFGPGLLIGRSAHTLGEVEKARDEGADYATFGPVYPTPSKAAFGPPLGLAAFERAAALGLPVYALGGVTLERLPDLARAGAAGIAGIRIFLEPQGLDALVTAARVLFPPRSPAPTRPEP
ncbi:MAG TPA: thiamine phosphate synthase [Thermoanaerobaculia bacterium]|jgi:thiamine-phosphate pyrophosphorylase|nr:thiamine phosphate synthase [Thermoanaerobaculia bacterium]